jgi:hypothetical protein
MEKNIATAELQSSRLTPAQEYDSLRDELKHSKQYVFERPLVIVGVGIALLTREGMQFGAALPSLLAGLLLFNYWFTVNRLKSASRIVAYIQVVLESDTIWKGWETSLREYRVWLNKNRKVKDKIVEDKDAVPDALMYYPPIYGMHIVLVVLCLIAGIVVTVKQQTLLNLGATLLLFVLAILFAYYCWKWRPSKMRSLIEREKVIWEHALGINIS